MLATPFHRLWAQTKHKREGSWGQNLMLSASWLWTWCNMLSCASAAITSLPRGAVSSRTGSQNQSLFPEIIFFRLFLLHWWDKSSSIVKQWLVLSTRYIVLKLLCISAMSFHQVSNTFVSLHIKAVKTLSGNFTRNPTHDVAGAI